MDWSLHGPLVQISCPLSSRKSAAEVDLNLQTKFFSFLATPHILHSDNGRQFVNVIVQNLVKE